MVKTSRASPALPFIVVFIASTCVMVLELVASRLIAQFVGSNLYTWTSIIAVVLAGLAAGNLAGGRLAERATGGRVGRALASVLVVSSLASLGIVLAVPLIFDFPTLAGLALPARVLLGVTVSFLVPAALLGCVSPLAATWAIKASPRVGFTVGQLYAVGSLGAILGTLLTGFVLVSTFGSTAIMVGLGAVLAMSALLVDRRAATLAGVLIALVAATLVALIAGKFPLSTKAVLAGDILFATESNYQTVAMSVDQHGMKVVVLDNLVHGFVYPPDPTVIIYPYIATYAAAYQASAEVAGRPLSSLHLGGGAFTLPRFIAVAYPKDSIVVAEIDPEVTRANQVAAGLGQPTPFEIVNMDAREVVRDLGREGRHFDLVFADAFKDYSVPFHLATVEFYELVDAVLEPSGVVFQNAIDDLSNPTMLAALVATVGKVHPHVLVFVTSGVDGSVGRNTFVIASSKEPIDSAAILDVAAGAGLNLVVLKSEDINYMLGSEDPQVLTDDFAPVERLIAHLYSLP